MKSSPLEKPQQEKRSEERTIVDEYYSVEFSLGGNPFLYRFKLWDVSSGGICVLVKEGSEILKLLQVGAIIKMTYFKPEFSGVPEELDTEIRHLTKAEEGRFKGHTLVGLSIVKERR